MPIVSKDYESFVNQVNVKNKGDPFIFNNNAPRNTKAKVRVTVSFRQIDILVDSFGE